MSAKILDSKLLARLSRYTAEELDPRVVDDESAMEAFIARNRDAIDAALRAGYLSLDAGRGVAVHSLEELLTLLAAEKAQRIGS